MTCLVNFGKCSGIDRDEQHEEVADTERPESNYNFYAASVRGDVPSLRHGSSIPSIVSALLSATDSVSLRSYQPDYNIVLAWFFFYLSRNAFRTRFTEMFTYFVRGFVGDTPENLIPQIIFRKVSVHLFAQALLDEIIWLVRLFDTDDNSRTGHTGEKSRASICGFAREETDASGHRMNGSPACETDILGCTWHRGM